MGIFSKKSTFAFSEILKGLQQAVSSATGMIQAQQMDNLSHFWTKEGKLVTKKVQIGDRPSWRICYPSVMSIRIFNPAKERKNNE